MHKGRYSNRLHLHARSGFVLLLALLIWSPIPFGSNRPWAEAFFATAVFSLLAVVFLAELWSASPQDSRTVDLKPGCWLMVAWLLWMVLQVIPLPAAVIQRVSIIAHDVQAPVLDPGQWMTISIDPGSSIAMILRISAVFAIMSLMFLLLSTRRRLLAFALVLVTGGLLEAIVGLGIYWSGAADLTAHIDSRDTIGPVGTYISRNHFAGFLEMALAMNMGLILIVFKAEVSGSGWRGRIQNLSAQILSFRALLLTAQIVMFAALILSGSRGGVLALLIAACIVVVMVAKDNGWRAVRAWTPVLLAVIGALAWFGGGAFVSRIGSLGLSSNRLDLAAVSLGIISDFPLTGSGAGTFRWVFPMYKDIGFGDLFYEHAHNDFLEIAIEQGLIGLALFLGLVGWLLYRTYRVYRERHDRLARGVSLGVILAGLSLLGHSMIDFNLQIPANLYWFFALLTAGVCAGRISHQGRVNPHETS